MRLRDKVAIITGGGRGIGRAYALRLANEGARVAVAEIAAEAAQEVAAEIEAAGGRALALATDVSREESAQEMALRTVEEFGRIDILVNNAAIMFRFLDQPMKPWDQWSSDEWDRILAVNVKGMYYCIKAVVPHMKTLGRGKIINISSQAFFNGAPFILPYVASKGAVIGLTRVLARELGDYDINVNAITPGLTQSETILEMMPAEESERLAAQACLKRKQQPEDLAGTVVFLASDDSDFITGQIVNVDGGIILH